MLNCQALDISFSRIQSHEITLLSKLSILPKDDNMIGVWQAVNCTVSLDNNIQYNGAYCYSL